MGESVARLLTLCCIHRPCVSDEWNNMNAIFWDQGQCSKLTLQGAGRCNNCFCGHQLFANRHRNAFTEVVCDEYRGGVVFCYIKVVRLQYNKVWIRLPEGSLCSSPS